MATKRIRVDATTVPSTLQQTSFATATAAADAIASNDDLSTEILRRLPIKNLLKFKSVSKHWLSLISSPHFSRLRNPNPNSVSGLFLGLTSGQLNPKFDFIPLDDNKSDITPFKSLPFVDDQPIITILNSCNGLLCCTSSVDGRYYVYNPTTRQYTTLPKTIDYVLGMNLAFDPSKSPHYKVVCVQTGEWPDDHRRIEIYSSETGLWKFIGDTFTATRRIDRLYRGVFWNGAVHWVGCNQLAILRFDVDQEQLQEIPMPPIPDGISTRNITYFGESRDHMYLVEIQDICIAQFNVYEMERDCSGWFVKYRVDLDTVARAFPELICRHQLPDFSFYAFHVLCIVRGETDEDLCLVLYMPAKAKAIRYYLKDETCKKLCDLESGFYEAHQYIESLSSV
ncbi:hypothetical protein L1049_014183 [Liquidambar formosana]|uniref:F-box domain-containing protein n=1 Tax=Liquidambar formosana TaxID=63359 RepID=A0AAP0RLI8_LIQFO